MRFHSRVLAACRYQDQPISTDPRHQIAAPRGAFQDPREIADRRIAALMSVGVVDLLEIVEIAIDQRAGLVSLDHPGVASATDHGQWVEIGLEAGADPQAILRRAMETGVTIDRFELTEPSLREIFLERAGARRRADDDEAEA